MALYPETPGEVLTFRPGEERPNLWRTSRRIFRFPPRPLIMGVLNVTPDSFYDGGRYLSPEDAVRQAERMVDEGADIIDIGGESTRPFSSPVDEREEIRRILPVLKLIIRKFDLPISIDTYKSGVARITIEEGAEIINDISALRFDKGMAETVATYRAGVVLMHIRGQPADMQIETTYDDLLNEIASHLDSSLVRAERSGISREHTVIDPGIGFGKKLEDNYRLIRSIPFFQRSGRPVMVGPSRKSFIWKILGSTPEDSLEGTISASIFSYLYGADILRVHDVGAIRKALVIARRFVDEGKGES